MYLMNIPLGEICCGEFDKEISLFFGEKAWVDMYSNDLQEFCPETVGCKLSGILITS